jgi:hypothetical protein
MLRDPRAAALVENFAGQWLHLRNLAAFVPDRTDFPEFDDLLRQAMRRETELFVGSMMTDDRSALDLLQADYTFMNERLARHYGVDDVYGSAFRRVQVTDPMRRGLLGHASVLAVTSYPNRTSPVLRGKWILENVLGTPPSPPPPDLSNVLPDTVKPTTMKERMASHRRNAVCASCHKVMDPLGFALENFDAIGRWRTTIGTEKVDSAAEMPTGEKFQGPSELKKIVLARKDEFTRNLVEKMLAYSLGRGLEPFDIPTVRGVSAAVAKDGYRSTTLVREIVKSYPFQYRKNQ